MSIPERLFRLARGKIGEIREMFEGGDQELDPELVARVQRAQARNSARRELDDAVSGVDAGHGVPAANAAPAPRPAGPLRTPSEIRGTGAPSTSAASGPATPAQDTLAPHYHMLGVEPGADFATVQSVYEKLKSRCDAGRFPAGSPEAVEAHDIQTKLEATYKALREALDPTARRFDLLEL